MAFARKLLSATDFAGAARIGQARGATVCRLAELGVAATTAGERCLSYTFSTAGVKRDNCTINQAGWRLDNFRACPSFLWAHDSGEPPIGQVIEIGVSGGALRGTVEYADADTYPFADTIYRLAAGGFIRAVSVAWNPIKWDYTKDRSRPGGVDFIEQELLEISQVPLPADPDALASARSRGVNTAPLAAWAERALSSRTPLPMPRAQIETLYRSAKPPTPARNTLPRNFVKLDTIADRRKYLRFLAYEGARTGGADVPAEFLPANTFDERAALVSARQIRERAAASRPRTVTVMDGPARSPKTRAARAALVRALAFEGYAAAGTDLPAFAWPPVTPAEHAAVAAGLAERQRKQWGI